MLDSFTNQLPPTLAIALSLDNAPFLRAVKNIFHRQPQPGVRSGFRLGFLRFWRMDHQLSSHLRSLCSPLAFLPSGDGRYRIFFMGRYVGGFWSRDEIVRVENAQPQSEDELIQLLDQVAADSAVLERSPP